MEKPDVTIHNHGTIFTFDLHTEAAHEWVDEHVHVKDYMQTGNGFHCEHRYAYDIALGMQADGLTVD